MFCNHCRCKITESDAQFCPNCGANLRAQPQNNVATTEQPRQKSKKRKITIIALIVTLVTAMIIGTAVLMIANRQQCFKMQADGTLYLEDYAHGTVLIPAEFDGKARSLDHPNTFYGSFEYDGSLKRFLKYYSWLINQHYPKDGIFIYCADYTLLFAANGSDLGSVVIDDNGETRMITVHFTLYQNEKEIQNFKTFGDLFDWLQ